MVLAAGAAARFPAHFHSRVPLLVEPSRTLCSACHWQFSLSSKSPNSRTTFSRFLRCREGFRLGGNAASVEGFNGS